jgi:hypothetical protein
MIIIHFHRVYRELQGFGLPQIVRQAVGEAHCDFRTLFFIGSIGKLRRRFAKADSTHGFAARRMLV